jgi:hypothetical protein
LALAPLLLLLSATAAADGAKPSAVEALAKKVAAALTAQRFEAPCALQVDAAQPALAQALAAALAPALNCVAPTSPDVRTAVKLSVALEGQNLVVRGSTASTWVNFWSGSSARPPPPRPLGDIAQEADGAAVALATGQSGTHLPPVVRAPLALKVSALAQLPQVPAALACRDVDGDNRAELAVLLSDVVLLLSNDGKVLGRYDLRAVPLAKLVAREPFGAIALSGKPTRVAFFTGRHEHGQTLELERGAFKVVASSEAFAVLEGVQVRVSPGSNTFAADVRLGDKPLALPAALQSLNASKGVRLFQFANGWVSLARGESVPQPSLDSGAAAALADFDGDGTPEVLTSARDAFPKVELLSVFALPDVERPAESAGAAVTPLWRASLSRGRAMVAAGCDLNGDGKEEVVVGAWLDDGTGELEVVSGQ